MSGARPDPVTLATGSVLAGLGALHVAWGRGSTWPFPDHGALTDRVVGRSAAPSAVACYAVAGLLGTAAALVAGPDVGLPRLRATGQIGVATVLGARATVGFLGRTDLVSPGSASPAFRRNDRRIFSPLCTALALGAGRAGARTLRADSGRR
jgi:hypothetical protein